MAWSGQHFTSFYNLPDEIGRAGWEGAALNKVPLAVIGVEGLSSNEEISNQGQEKKRRLSPEQMEYLEKSFNEETKLDPERKLLLARQVGLQPRQVAVWFQNRRARWKTKHLERLYASLKQDYDAVSQEKQKLQDEVVQLKAQLMGKASSQCLPTGKEEEMLDSMVIVQCSNSICNQSHFNSTLQATDNSHLLRTDQYGNWCTFSRHI